MAVNLTPVGQETQVNTSVTNEQDQPDVAVATDGRFFVAWTTEQLAGDQDIFGQFFNADGTKSGGQVPIDIDGSDNAGNDQSSPAVAPRLGGGVAVVYRDTDLGGLASADISLRVVSSAGVAGPLLTVSNSGEPRGAPDAALLTNGQVVIVWHTDFGTNFDVGLRVLNAAGTGFTGGEIFVDFTSTFDSVTPAIAAIGNNALIAYRDDNAGDILVKLFNGDTGTLSSSFSTLGTVVASDGGLRRPDVAALTNGVYVVIWENDTNDDVEGRFVDASGNPIGGVFTIANNAGQNEDPRVAALPDGGFIVTWNTSGGVIAPEDGADWAVLARRFDSTGAPAGDLFLVNTGDPNTDQFFPTVAANTGTGQAFIAWEDNHSFTGTGEDNDPAGVRGRAFVATTDVVNGTSGDDALTTYSLGETISGLDGNDTINAAGGNDIVDGGLGDDSLLGGFGDDALAGGDGADTLNGEDGNDVLDGGPGGDLLFGGAGDDAMTGGDGADTVNGGDGSDTINGNLGNDVLTGGPGADSFLFSTAIKPKGSNIDTIADFSAADDVILLDNAIFTKLKTEGALKEKWFDVGKKAHDKNDFIVYNKKTGDLFYDKNGDKKGGAILFAKLEGSPDDVSAADFFVV